MQGASSVPYYVQTDHLDTPRVITDTANTVVWRWDNTGPFGGNAPVGSITMNLRFPGQCYDVESGLSHNGARDYSLGLGRYVESDPIGLAGGINTYAYVRDNPMSRIDPKGLLDGFPSAGDIGGQTGAAMVGKYPSRGPSAKCVKKYLEKKYGSLASIIPYFSLQNYVGS